MSHLPPLPPMPSASDRRKRFRIVVTVNGTPDISAAYGADWGGVTTGRYVGGGDVRDILGVCERCGQLRPARDLVDRIRPFGRGEVRQCRGGCP